MLTFLKDIFNPFFNASRTLSFEIPSNSGEIDSSSLYISFTVMNRFLWESTIILTCCKVEFLNAAFCFRFTSKGWQLPIAILFILDWT